MKVIIVILTLVSATLSLSAQSGYCFSTSLRGSFENTKATKFDKIKTNTEQTNIYTFSFKDSLLVHHIVKDAGTICQFYKITLVEKLNNNAYLIGVISGSSGSEYFYYINDDEDNFGFYQIDTIDGEKMGGTKFDDFGFIDLITYVQ